MTRSNIDRAMKVLTAEVKEIVASYFSPVRAVMKDMRRSVEQATRHSESAGESDCEKPPTRH